MGSGSWRMGVYLTCFLASCFLRGHLGTWVLSKCQAVSGCSKPAVLGAEEKRKLSQTPQPGQEPANAEPGSKERSNAISVYQLVWGHPAASAGFQAPTCQGPRASPSAQRGTTSAPRGPGGQAARPGALHPLGRESRPPSPRRRKWLLKEILHTEPAIQDPCYPGNREAPLGSRTDLEHPRGQLTCSSSAPSWVAKAPTLHSNAGRCRPRGGGVSSRYWACLRPRKACGQWARQVRPCLHGVCSDPPQGDGEGQQGAALQGPCLNSCC